MGKFQYKHYSLVLLTVVAAFSYLDRGLLAMAMEPIKQEFQLSDSQLGFMSGFAFALFYAVAGIPIARWADRGNRNHVVSLTTMLWSIMVTISGLAGNFAQLLLMRVGVAVGESGCIPPAQSLISDYFPRAERPRAMAVYWMASPLSVILAYLGGGWLIEQYGWRITFIVMGIPGILLAILVKFSLREPRLKKTETTYIPTTTYDKALPKQPPLNVVLITLWQKTAFRHVVMAFCIAIFFVNGIGAWIPAFYMRTHGMDAGTLGTWLALTWGILALFATFFGGILATRYAPNKEGLQMKAIAILMTLCSVFYVFCFLSSNKYFSLIFISIGSGGLMSLAMAPAYAAIQSLVEERMRAVALAFIFMLSNLIGLGLGPVAVGMISDALAPSLGKESLRYALLLFSPGLIWCAFHNWKAASTIEEEIRSVELKEDSTESTTTTLEPEISNNFSTVN